MQNQEIHSLFLFFKKYQTLSKEAEDAVSKISKVVTFKKHYDFQPVGHTCKTIYFISKGLARIYYLKDGVDVTESFSFENDIIARVESLFTGKPSRKAIQTIEDSVLIAIDSDKLFRLFDKHPDLERLFRKIIETSYVNTVNRMESLQFNTADERYFNLIKDHPNILKRVPLKFIASYLGITPVSLSRIRSAK